MGGVIVRCCCNAGSTGSTLGAGLTTLADDSGMWSSSNGLYLGSRQKMKVTLSTLSYLCITLSIHYFINTFSHLYIILSIHYQYIILYIQDLIDTLHYQYIILYIQDLINTLPYLYITLYIQYLIHILPYLYITQEYISLNNKLRYIANFGPTGPIETRIILKTTYFQYRPLHVVLVLTGNQRDWILSDLSLLSSGFTPPVAGVVYFLRWGGVHGCGI